jgi:hypothetical protein
MSEADAIAWMMEVNAGVWAERIRHFENAPLHWEWYRLRASLSRGAFNAPREHAKTEVFTVNGAAHDSIYRPGCWTYVFAETLDLAKALKERIDEAILEDEEHRWIVDRARTMKADQSVYANGSRITTAGAGKSVRGAHPDVIIGDDVLSDQSTDTAYQRRKTHRWWFGTVGGMGRPGGFRRALVKQPNGEYKWTRAKFGGTRIFLVGTPFHHSDLLMTMKENPLYRYRRYAAEFEPGELPLAGSLAVEAT